MKNKNIKRSFIPGDEWIYFKLYSGTKTADQILIEIINTTTETLLNSGKIDQWFFIRYADPEIHLRVRLHCLKHSQLGNIIQFVSKNVSKMVEAGLIWKVQIDTYQRELERYGTLTVELSEKLFFYESNLFLQVLRLFNKSNGEKQRWVFALVLIDNILDCFRFTLPEKLLFMSNLKNSFADEFGMNNFLKVQIDNSYRGERKYIENSLFNTSLAENITADLLIHINQYKNSISSIAKELLQIKNSGKLEIPFENLIQSYIHMSMNRNFRSKQRLHELLLYDFLYRHYKSMTARSDQSKKSN